MKLLVDTNVVARIAQGNHKQHAMAIEAVANLAAKGFTPSILPQVVYEFWAIATRPIEANGLGLHPNQAINELAKVRQYFQSLRDERGIFRIWEDLVSRYEVKGKRTHDARLVAAMTRHRIEHLLTFDVGHFAGFSEIRAIDPGRAEGFSAATHDEGFSR